MTNREAIGVFQAHVVFACEKAGLSKAAVKEVEDALDLAISALEFKERYDQFWEEVKTAGTKGKETEIHHSGRVFRIREVAQ